MDYDGTKKLRKSVRFLSQSLLDASKSLIRKTEWDKSPASALSLMVVWITRVLDLQVLSCHLLDHEREYRELRQMTEDLYHLVSRQLETYRATQIENERCLTSQDDSPPCALGIFLATIISRPRLYGE